LSEERVRSETETDVRNLVANLRDFTQRLTTMRETLTLARQLTSSTLTRYRAGEVTLVEMLQAVTRESTTSNNYLNAFMGYQRTLRRLKEVTFFDFEVQRTVIDRFGIGRAEEVGRR
jgi:outer membrane protein TolC